MSKLPVPDLIVNSVYELTARRLSGLGISLLLLDLDNTLLPYRAKTSPPGLRQWIDSLKEGGVEPFLFSNNRSRRPAAFAASLGIDFVSRAKKPFTGKLKKVMEKKALPRERIALAGDQIYTDVLCAKRAGILAIAVRPICLKNPLRALRFGAELPFRLACRAGEKDCKRRTAND